ncbi:3483_t:CDS:2 [Gigaspora margarita]|uniref:3483_t:CDS:1 n=1 Tax=Gigaspora margarita TaxID=4874 RepID=A0ABM8W1L3_GIGMA|nr:3483_t:CDS:2 [Gigaspora margarita]
MDQLRVENNDQPREDLIVYAACANQPEEDRNCTPVEDQNCTPVDEPVPEVLAHKTDPEEETLDQKLEKNLTEASLGPEERGAALNLLTHFKHYLSLDPFVVVTDHVALKWLQTSSLTSHRAR